MLFHLSIKEPCNCFSTSGFALKYEFKSKDEAKKDAEYIMRIMKTNFCQKHRFALKELDDGFEISMHKK